MQGEDQDVGKAAEESRDDVHRETHQGFLTVGIGASAGGLEAIETFFKALPARSGIAFVVISHLSPDHVSLLPELIGRQTDMEVVEITDGLEVEPNFVYVLPPGKDISIMGGKLLLFDPVTTRGVNLPIDTFLRALAQDQESKAGCIILSGTGSDGTLGVRSIKELGGVVLVQDENSATHSGMPRSAVATGLADYVLAPQEMPACLIRYSAMALSGRGGRGTTREQDQRSLLTKACALLRTRSGHDFSSYKLNTISRRIERRMNVHHIGQLQDYITYLRKDPGELDLLFKELLIGVTNFFRDQEAFDDLRDRIMPEVLLGRPREHTVRVWIPGCSTGEEAYSIAIVLHECMEAMGRHFPVQVFATDIDEDAVEVARNGLYPRSISVDVSEERLTRYFVGEEDGLRIRQSIREMIVFAPQNIIKDPPFTRLDLLCCRNLLIYLEQDLQRKLLPLFHYSLLPEGVLMLGSSETIGPFADLFETVGKKWRTFRRRPGTTPDGVIMNFPPVRGKLVAPDPDLPFLTKPSEEVTVELARAILEETGAPPCVVIDHQDHIVYIHGPTRDFLELPEGRARLSILDMARPGLKGEIATAIRMARAQKRLAVRRRLSTHQGPNQLTVDLVVKPLAGQRTLSGMMMVLFEKVPPPDGEQPENQLEPQVRGEGSSEELQEELLRTRERLQITVEEMESANEELKSTNEELQSTNEELQSANEEMETSKEELQSLNEEAASVNTELQGRIDELSQTNDDMKNLLRATRIATVFLDINLKVRLFTPSSRRIIPLEDSDIGRPIAHFATNLEVEDLSQHAREVLDDLSMREIEIGSKDGGCYLVRIMPYRTVNNVIDGVVITFDEITDRKAAEERVRDSETGWRSLSEASPDASLLIDLNGIILFANRPQWTVGSSEEMLGERIHDHLPGEAAEAARMCMEKVRETGIACKFEMETPHEDGAPGQLETVVGPVFKEGEIVALSWYTRRSTDRPGEGVQDHGDE